MKALWARLRDHQINLEAVLGALQCIANEYIAYEPHTDPKATTASSSDYLHAVSLVAVAAGSPSNWGADMSSTCHVSLDTTPKNDSSSRSQLSSEAAGWNETKEVGVQTHLPAKAEFSQIDFDIWQSWSKAKMSMNASWRGMHLSTAELGLEVCEDCGRPESKHYCACGGCLKEHRNFDPYKKSVSKNLAYRDTKSATRCGARGIVKEYRKQLECHKRRTANMYCDIWDCQGCDQFNLDWCDRCPICGTDKEQ